MFNYFSRDFLAMYLQANSGIQMFVLMLTGMKRFKEKRILQNVCVLTIADIRSPDAFNECNLNDLYNSVDNWISVIELYIFQLRTQQRHKWEVKHMTEILWLLQGMRDYVLKEAAGIPIPRD